MKNRIISYDLGNGKIQKQLAKGSPQGSPLSPLLWNLTIADLLNIKLTNETKIQAFADDIASRTGGKTRKEIEKNAQEALTTVLNWSTTSNIPFNPLKCQAILLGKNNQKDHQ